MSRNHTTLEEFLAMDVPNLNIRYKSMNAYMRKGRVLVDEKICNALTIANLTNRRRMDNITVNPKPKRTGLFREFETHVRQLAAEHGYDGVFVELVHNPFLPDVLTRYGYKRVNIRGIGDYLEHNYWFPVREEDGQSG